MQNHLAFDEAPFEQSGPSDVQPVYNTGVCNNVLLTTIQT